MSEIGMEKPELRIPERASGIRLKGPFLFCFLRINAIHKYGRC